MALHRRMSWRLLACTTLRPKPLVWDMAMRIAARLCRYGLQTTTLSWETLFQVNDTASFTAA